MPTTHSETYLTISCTATSAPTQNSSPTPWTPSSVSTRTKLKFRNWVVWVEYVFTEVIFIGIVLSQTVGAIILHAYHRGKSRLTEMKMAIL